MKRISLLIAASILCLSAAAEWKPAGGRIMTIWGENLNPEAPLPEYPRPQMVRRDWVNLNGLWNYGITDASADSFSADGEILVPFPVESALSGVGKEVGPDKALWYERTFSVPSKWKGRDILLHFGAVDWKTEVWVNGKKVGEHSGGYTPFSFNITPALRKSGKQTLRVRVLDGTDSGWQPRGKQVQMPKGIWYTPVTGIWQTVWMEPVPEARISSYYVVSDIDNAKCSVEVAAEGLKAGDRIEVELLDGGLGYSAENPGSTVVASAAAEGGKAEIAVPGMKFWSPGSPWLYGLRISIRRGGKAIDSIDGYTSFRKISGVVEKTRDGNRYHRLALNNEVLFQFGPLDQGWWPDGLYTAPSDEALRFDVVKTKEMGFNMIRKHIKVEPARWFYWCDVLGIMVWQDMPCIGDHSLFHHRNGERVRSEELEKRMRNQWSSDAAWKGSDCDVPREWKENYYKEWGEIIASVKNFQCIVVWVPFNEGWGQFDTRAVVEFTRSQDPTRLINEASGGNYREAGDILDLHHYPNPAMHGFDKDRINVLGEYGGIGMVVAGHTWNKDANWGYNGVKKDGHEVMETYRDFADMLKPLIRCGFSAAVYTQTTDVEVEVNGLMTYDRKVVKMDSGKLSAINESVIRYR